MLKYDRGMAHFGIFGGPDGSSMIKLYVHIVQYFFFFRGMNMNKSQIFWRYRVYMASYDCMISVFTQAHKQLGLFLGCNWIQPTNGADGFVKSGGPQLVAIRMGTMILENHGMGFPFPDKLRFVKVRCRWKTPKPQVLAV